MWLHKNVDRLCAKETTREGESEPGDDTEGKRPAGDIYRAVG